MAAWKGDERFELDSNDDSDPDYRESSDDSDESDIPRTMARMRAQWIVDHQSVLSEIYKPFLEHGRVVFGDAFFQLGGIRHFANLCFKYTHPGAVKSDS